MPAPIYNIKITPRVTTIQLEFENFQQSERFQKILAAFILKEGRNATPAIKPTHSHE